MMQRLHIGRWLPACARALLGALSALLSPAAVVVILMLVGCGCVVTGVHMLLGAAWAFIAAGVALMILSALVARGMTGG